MSFAEGLRKTLRRNETILFLTTAAICLAIGLINPAFFSVATVFDTARAMLLMMMFALCEMLVIISGGIDVSFPAVATLSMYATMIFTKAQGINNIWFMFLMGGAIGVLCGLLNGLLIGTFKIPALIATLGASSFINGGMLTLLGSKEITIIPDAMEQLYKAKLISVQMDTGVMYTMTPLIFLPIGMCLLFYFLLRYTMFGRSVYAIGGDAVSAQRMGFHVCRTQYLVYMLSGFIAGITGIVYSTLMRSANATNLMGEEMMVIAAVVIGGVRISGGKGSVLGVVLGVLLINIVSSNLIILGIPNYWQRFVVGAIIVLGTCLTSLREKMIASSPKI